MGRGVAYMLSTTVAQVLLQKNGGKRNIAFILLSTVVVVVFHYSSFCSFCCVAQQRHTRTGSFIDMVDLPKHIPKGKSVCTGVLALWTKKGYTRTRLPHVLCI